mmetsp:Transcript_10515/g.19977  ORF Transcript_10515/g.19977 Transcript_10515/m.19977 type:complete len:269 (-) Transcript_10515:248-1054(-)|eukprot:CAMPEP_0114248384 /NCGR_PEP_ID=MMETSP0058-20121206/13545_1 /TAXON_ID=36894 /ORGANISM="Pyramimonas parkeae, CCMP726" /LENGTH=268 /DNA_ID=CAMNT_0001361789 /DNA_START=116 /DNA_END=922 /DNA_ORIENTATION=-
MAEDAQQQPTSEAVDRSDSLAKSDDDKLMLPPIKRNVSVDSAAPLRNKSSTTKLPLVTGGKSVGRGVSGTFPGSACSGGELAAHVGRTSSSWSDDSGVASWLKQKEKIESARRSKSVREAMKDANWVLSRREKQMKQIQRRQRQEKALLKEEERNPLPVRAPVKTKPAVAAPSQTHNRNRQDSQMPAERLKILEKFRGLGNTVKSIASATLGMGFTMSSESKFPRLANDGPLSWQTCPKVKPHKMVSRDRDTAVWVMPGVFVTKKVTY